MKPVYQISQVIATPEGEWVNAEVFAVLSNPKPPRGKGPWTASLTDSSGTILGKFWGGSIEHWAGKRVKISGAGMQRKAYQGVPELSVGQKADISFGGAPGTAAQQDDGNPDLEAATPPQTRTSVQAVPPPQRPYVGGLSAPAVPSGAPVHPATVGMCMKMAGDFLLREDGWGKDSAARIEAIARSLIEVAQRLERGEPPANEPF